MTTSLARAVCDVLLLYLPALTNCEYGHTRPCGPRAMRLEPVPPGEHDDPSRGRLAVELSEGDKQRSVSLALRSLRLARGPSASLVSCFAFP